MAEAAKIPPKITGKWSIADALEAALENRGNANAGRIVDGLPWKIFGDSTELALTPKAIDQLASSIDKAEASGKYALATHSALLEHMLDHIPELQEDAEFVTSARQHLFEQVRAQADRLAKEGRSPSEIQTAVRREIDQLHKNLRQLGKVKAFQQNNFLRDAAVEHVRSFSTRYQHDMLSVAAETVAPHQRLKSALQSIGHTQEIVSPAELNRMSAAQIEAAISELDRLPTSVARASEAYAAQLGKALDRALGHEAALRNISESGLLKAKEVETVIHDVRLSNHIAAAETQLAQHINGLEKTKAAAIEAAEASKAALSNFTAEIRTLKADLITAGKAKGQLHGNLIKIVGPERAEQLMKGIFTHQTPIEALGDIPKEAKPILTLLEEKRATLKTLHEKAESLRGTTLTQLSSEQIGSQVDQAVAQAKTASDGFTGSEVRKATLHFTTATEKAAADAKALAGFRAEYSRMGENISTLEKQLLQDHDALAKLVGPEKADGYLKALKTGEAISHEGLEAKAIEQLNSLQKNHGLLQEAKTAEQGFLTTARAALSDNPANSALFEEHIHDVNDGIRSTLAEHQTGLDRAAKAKQLGKGLDQLLESRTNIAASESKVTEKLGTLKFLDKEIKASAKIGTVEETETLLAQLRKIANRGNPQEKLAVQEAINLLTTHKGHLSAADAAHTLIKEAAHGQEAAHVSNLTAEIDTLAGHARSPHMSADKLTELRKQVSAIDAFEGAHDTLKGTNSSASGFIKSASEAAGNIGEQAAAAGEKAAAASKSASKFGGKGVLIAGGAAVVGAVAAVLAFGDKPKGRHTQRLIDEQGMDPRAMGM